MHNDISFTTHEHFTTASVLSTAGNSIVSSTATLYMILPTDQEIIPARNAVYAHAQDFFGNEELLLPIFKAVAQYACSLQATRNSLFSFSVQQQNCLSRSLTTVQ